MDAIKQTIALEAVKLVIEQPALATELGRRVAALKAESSEDFALAKVPHDPPAIAELFGRHVAAAEAMRVERVARLNAVRGGHGLPPLMRRG